MTLKYRLQQACKARGISQSDLAEQVGIHRQQLTSIFNGKLAKSKHLPAIAAALGVQVEWLTTGSPAHAPAWASVPPPTPADPTTALAAELAQARAENAALQTDLAQMGRLAAENARLKDLLARAEEVFHARTVKPGKSA